MTTHNTGIEWTHVPGYTGETWNPIVGCTIVSPGCTNCYAMRVAGARLDGNPKTPHYAGTTKPSKAGPVWTGKVALAGEKTLTAPLRWTKPRAVFVNSMGDLFHEDVPDWWIYLCLAVMAETYDVSATDENHVITGYAQRHAYLLLTKRAARMQGFMSALHELARSGDDFLAHPFSEAVRRISRHRGAPVWQNAPLTAWQWVADGCPGLWLGVSVEDQARADERIPHLLATPAAVRFVSAEPLLGPVDLTRVVDTERGGLQLSFDALTGLASDGEEIITGVFSQPDARLDWVIAGGESGKGARPMHPDWARGLLDQCRSAGVPYFFKQWGEWLGCDQFGLAVEIDDDPGISRFDHREWEDDRWSEHFRPDWTYWENVCTSQVVVRIGKARAGHQLDGETHHNWPEVKG